MQFFFLRFYLFIWQTEITSRQRGRQRERGGSRLPAEQRAWCWARWHGPGIMTRAKGRGFNPLSHPGTPKLCFFIFLFFFKDFIYLFDRQRSQVGREAGKEAGSLLSREPDVGLDPRTPRSWPEPKAEALTHWATQVPYLHLYFYLIFFLPFPYVHLYCFLNSTYEWNHMVFHFPWLTYFT